MPLKVMGWITKHFKLKLSNNRALQYIYLLKTYIYISIIAKTRVHNFRVNNTYYTNDPNNLKGRHM